jgi:type VI secretion system protein ImpG
VKALCTNRDLPLHLVRKTASRSEAAGASEGENPQGSDFFPEKTAPLLETVVVSGPSRPSQRLHDHTQAWQLISHLSLNQLHLSELSPQEGASALRALLELYLPWADASLKHQIDGLRSTRVEPGVHRIPGAGRLVFARSLCFTLVLDESCFPEAGAFLFCLVLSRFMARFAPINTPIEVLGESSTRGVFFRSGLLWGRGGGL